MHNSQCESQCMGWATPMLFASINPINPRTNLWKFSKRSLWTTPNLLFIHLYYRSQLFQKVCGPILHLMIFYSFFWMRLTHNFVNQSKTQWIIVCLNRLFCMHIFFKTLIRKTWISFHYIGKIRSHSHLEYRISLNKVRGH